MKYLKHKDYDSVVCLYYINEDSTEYESAWYSNGYASLAGDAKIEHLNFGDYPKEELYKHYLNMFENDFEECDKETYDKIFKIACKIKFELNKIKSELNL